MNHILRYHLRISATKLGKYSYILIFIDVQICNRNKWILLFRSYGSYRLFGNKAKIKMTRKLASHPLILYKFKRFRNFWSYFIVVVKWMFCLYIAIILQCKQVKISIKFWKLPISCSFSKLSSWYNLKFMSRKFRNLKRFF